MRRYHLLRDGLRLLILAGAAGCNEMLDTRLGVLPRFTLDAPSSAEAVPGPSVTLAWSGGVGPYQVELAFDPAFQELVRPLHLRPLSETSVVVDGLPGGRFYWRVRCPGCGPDGISDAGELRVTCIPRRLADDVAPGEAALAWNERDGEYGVVFTRGEPPALHLLRTDRLGNVIFGPAPLENPDRSPVLDPAGGIGTPALVYVPSEDRWAITARGEDSGEVVLALVDDNARVLGSGLLWLESTVLGTTSEGEGYDVRYHPLTRQVLALSDGEGAARIDAFDGDLSPAIRVTHPGAAPGSRILELTAPQEGTWKVLLAAPHAPASDGAPLSLALVIVDLRRGYLSYPRDLPDGTTGITLGQAGTVPPTLRMAWNQQDDVVGLVYTEAAPGAPAGLSAHFLAIEPFAGHLGLWRTRLTEEATVKEGSPRVAWDGEEYLVGWIDARDADAGEALRLTRFDGVGRILRTADLSYADLTETDDEIRRPPAIVGHDRIHTIAYVSDRAGARTSLSMCIEPPG